MSSSPLPELSSDTEGFQTPKKSLWSASFNNGQPQPEDYSDDHSEDQNYSSDADEPLRQPIFLSSDDLIVWSSPLVGSKQEIQLKKKGKRLREQEQRRENNLATALAQKERDLIDVLKLLETKRLRFGELLEFVFNPANGQGSVRWHQFFAQKEDVHRILDFWACGENSKQARETLRDWAVNHVASHVAREARSVTKSKLLQTRDVVLDHDFINSFSFSALNEKLKDSAPIAMRILEAFATSRRAETEHSERRKERTTMVVTSAALTCLGEYSHSNNLSKRIVGLYLYASGAQRQTITVLSTLGLSESYTNVITKNKRRRKKPKAVTVENAHIPDKILVDEEKTQPPSIYTGTLHHLSDSLRSRTRDIAATGLYATVYDNINMMFRNAEQIIGRHDSQENGTCATVVPLFNANPEDMKTKDYQQCFLEAPSLKIVDVLHSSSEQKEFKRNLIFTILRIIVTHGGESFIKFKEDLERDQPWTKQKIPLHKTNLHPLPAWNIDESSITGNVEVDEAITEELGLDKAEDFGETLRFYAGDQLSLARFRSIELIRAGHEDGPQAFFGTTWMAGLFHTKMADVTGTLFTHWGKPNTGSRNPGSLWFHNTRLDRLPITLTSLPSFRVCRDIIFVSLYARVLHLLLLVAGVSSLDQYVQKHEDWATLIAHAELVYDRYASTSVVRELRRKRKTSSTGTEGDMVFENAVLFLRDGLISREFTDAVKGGDSGRVVLVLKIWALSFRGNGRTKYAYEMLHLIHNLSTVWSPAIRAIVLNNWLLNPTGHPNSWVEIDLMQEHLNYWIKVFYKAHGSNASWEWIESIAPCVEVLRQLSKNFNDILGADQGMRHAPADLTDDIHTLMDSLDENNVYRIQRGRVLDGDDELVKDVIEVGLQNLTEGNKNPLSEYNQAFQNLQARRRMKPVVSEPPAPDPDPVPQLSITTIPPRQEGFSGFGMGREGMFGAEVDADETIISLFGDHEGNEDEPGFSTTGADDVALDMDSEWNYGTPEKSDDESEYDSDESDDEMM